MAGPKAWITVMFYLSPHLQPVVSLSEDVVKLSQTFKHPVASSCWSPPPPITHWQTLPPFFMVARTCLWTVQSPGMLFSFWSLSDITKLNRHFNKTTREVQVLNTKQKPYMCKEGYSSHKSYDKNKKLNKNKTFILKVHRLNHNKCL